MKKRKRLFRFTVLTFVLLLGGLFFIDKITQSKEDYSSKYIYVYDREDQSAVIEKNEKRKAFPASLTKIMTTLVALEHIDNLSEIAPVDVDTYQTMVANNASMAGFYGLESTTYRDLLYGTMLASGGEAANSLAINVVGTVDDFVLLMNQKADDLGLKDTHFTNVEGFHDDDQYTTAYDMALLLDYALQNNHFRAIFTSPYFTTSQTLDHPDGVWLESTVLSKIPLEETVDFEIIGGKSGTTYEAGQCWAVLGTKNGKEYISIVMGAPLEDINHPSYSQLNDTINIFNQID